MTRYSVTFADKSDLEITAREILVREDGILQFYGSLGSRNSDLQCAFTVWESVRQIPDEDKKDG